MTLALYFAKRFLVSFIRVFLGIVLLVLLFDFLTNLNRLNGIENQVWNALILSFLRTTTYLSLAMPLIIMLSTLAFSVSLSRSNEFIISRASGLSALRSIFSVLICAFILGLISIFILDPTAGRMIGYYDVKLDTYFTSGPEETRAWTIQKNCTAPKAAGEIHTDFEKGFIRAETVSYKDFVANDGWVNSKTNGKMRLEGKDYIVKDGDVLNFRFNT